MYPSRGVELSLEERYRRIIAADAMIAATMAKTIYDKWGVEGLTSIKEELAKVFRGVVSRVARQVGARLKDGDVIDLAKVSRVIDWVTGIESEYTELTPTRGIVRASSCIAAKWYYRIFPEYCPLLLFASMLPVLASTINPKIKVRPTGSWLCKGDEYCEVLFEIEDT